MQIQSPTAAYSTGIAASAARKQETVARDVFANLMQEHPQAEKQDATTPSEAAGAVADNGVKSAVLLGQLQRAQQELKAENESGASEVIDETTFKSDKGKRLNYYSTQKWDIGVYRDNASTDNDPTVLVSVDESESGGSRKTYRVHINDINMADAPCYKMFGAICAKTSNWFDALSSFKWALDNNYGMDRIAPDGSHLTAPVNEQANPYDRLNFHATFTIAVENLNAMLASHYDRRLEAVRDTLLNMLQDFKDETPKSYTA